MAQIKFKNGGSINIPENSKDGGRGLSYDLCDPVGELQLRNVALKILEKNKKR